VGNTASTETMPFWRSDAQPALLYSLFYDPRPVNASAIAERFGLARDTVNREARRLTQAGIITWRAVGRSHVLEVVNDHPAISALRTLVDLTVGPLIDLRRLYDLDGVERVFVFGSWARRHLGERGPTPRDIDVLVVGRPDTYAVTSACLEMSGTYGIDVSPMIVNRREFDTRGDNVLLDEITTGPLVEVRR
jgi:predicted nucleotidyltransferase